MKTPRIEQTVLTQKFIQLTTILCLLIFGLLQIAQAQTLLIAEFTQVNSDSGFLFNNNEQLLPNQAATLSTPLTGTRVSFKYISIAGLPSQLQGDQCADIFVTANTDNIAMPEAAPNEFNQSFDNVKIEILRCTPAGVGSNTQRNLLTVTLNTGAPKIVANLGGESGNLIVSTENGGENVTFTSDFLSFAGTTQRAFAIFFTSIIPQIALNPNGLFADFSAVGRGSFATSPSPPFATTTAASVTVSGRVESAQGRGIRNAIVRLVDEQGQQRTVVTTSFGYYRFADVPAGQTYTISVSGKRYSFTQPAQVLNLTGDTDDINFVAIN